MATIDQLLNEIDEFEEWPLEEAGAAVTDPGSSAGGGTEADRDLVESVLSSFTRSPGPKKR